MTTEEELVNHQQTLYRSKNPTRRWLHCTRRDWIMDAIRKSAANGPRMRALEIGPGSGIYLPVLAELFETVVGADIEEAYLDNAKLLRAKHPNIDTVVDDVTNTKLPEASFDLILCSEVVEHIKDSAPAIKAMRRLLKPGGHLILSTPQKWAPLELACKIAFLPGIIQLVRLVYGESILKTGHINLMTAKTVTKQLDASGFEIQTRHKTGMYLPFIAEFTGNLGKRMLHWMETKMRGGFMDGLLWTQYYIAKAPER